LALESGRPVAAVARDLGVGHEVLRKRVRQAFIDMHRGRFGVEPICETLDVSASAYHQRATGERSARGVEDERLTGRIREQLDDAKVLASVGSVGDCYDTQS
jgi:transposase-like protein